MPLPLTEPRPFPPEHTIHAAFEGLAGGVVPWANVFWVRNGNQSQPSSAELATVATQMFAAFSSHFAPTLGTASVLKTCTLLYYGAFGADLEAIHTGSAPGTRTAGLLPANCAVCISWRVAAHYRGGHPRTYLCGATGDVTVNPKTFADSYVEEVRLAANAFLLDINGIAVGGAQDLHLGTVSFQFQKQWRTPPVFRDYTPAATLVDKRVDSMRRRLGPDL